MHTPTTNATPLSLSQDQLLSKLNAQQQEAVKLGWGPSLLVAGAGSGKTTVLTRRVAWLITQLNQRPATVLAVTFTNKAAAEMKLRLEGLLGEQTAKRLNIGTFHSICARFLRREIDGYQSPDGLKWKNNFVIYDEADTLSVIKAVVSRLNLDEKVFAPKEMRYAISGLKNDGINSHQFSQDARNYRDTRLAEIFNNYQMELARNNALDFDDLISVFSDLLEQNPEVRERIRDQFKHILVDEFQDTNQSQYRLIRLLSFDENPKDEHERQSRWEGRSLLVVGDVDQSIYSWRKADFRIILGFQNDFKEAALVKLEENYRSTATILKVANSIIENNSERLEKVLRCNRGEGGKVQCFAAPDETEEAFYVIQELGRLSARGLKRSDCCILYRTNAQSRKLEEVLVRSNVPYVMVGGTRFYDRAEVKDVIAYLKLVFNPADGNAFLRVINTPPRGLGKTTLGRLTDHAEAHNLSYLDAAEKATGIPEISGKAGRQLHDFAAAIKRWQNLAATGALSVSALLKNILKESTYLSYRETEAQNSKEEAAYDRVDNINQMVANAEEFELIADEPTLEAFLTNISLVSDLDSANLDQDSVKLMTLHAAKGLEFPTVFMLGLEEGLFPHVRSLNSKPALEEERRLMYVGVTRAEDRLYLTYSRRRFTFWGATSSGTNYTVPSRFLSEIAPECMSGFHPDSDVSASQSYEPQRFGQRPASNERGYDDGQRDQSAPQKQPQAKPRVLSRSGPKDESEIKPEPTFERFAVGDNVMHAKFGVGKIAQVIGEGNKELYNVEFQTAGKRLLDPRFAKLVKLES